MISVRVRCTVVKALLLSALLRRISLSPKSNLEKFSSFLLIAKPKAFVLLRNRVWKIGVFLQYSMVREWVQHNENSYSIDKTYIRLKFICHRTYAYVLYILYMMIWLWWCVSKICIYEWLEISNHTFSRCCIFGKNEKHIVFSCVWCLCIFIIYYTVKFILLL